MTDLSLYIVEGSTGSYDDRTTWVFGVYTSHTLAKEAVEVLNISLRLLGLSENDWVPHDDPRMVAYRASVDPSAYCDDGIYYSVRGPLPLNKMVQHSDQMKQAVAEVERAKARADADYALVNDPPEEWRDYKGRVWQSDS